MIERAIEKLKENGIEAFERMGILIIPVRQDDLQNLDQIAKDMKKLLDSFGYDKSWCLDPYVNEHKKTLEGEMYK